MDDQVPIACTITRAQMSARLAEMAAIGGDSLTEVGEQAGASVLRFRADEQTHARLASIVAAEAQCCAFLDLAPEQDFAGLKLTISGPGDAAPIVRDLVDAFRDAGSI
jgi:hypothetical protein